MVQVEKRHRGIAVTNDDSTIVDRRSSSNSDLSIVIIHQGLSDRPLNLSCLQAPLCTASSHLWAGLSTISTQSKTPQSCPTATPRTVAHQAALSMGFSRQEYCSGQPFPSQRDLPNPGVEPMSPTLQADSLMSELPGKLHSVLSPHQNIIPSTPCTPLPLFLYADSYDLKNWSNENPYFMQVQLTATSSWVHDTAVSLFLVRECEAGLSGESRMWWAGCD